MFKLKSVNIVTISKTNCFNEACGICKEGNNNYCLDCSSSGNTHCPVHIGECGHAYHAHCLDPWLKNRRVCPLDNKVWTLKIKQ
jgi:RING-box protein 1